MLSSAQPPRLPKPFAAAAGGGYIRTIPAASQIGIVNGAASLTDGFPPLNMTPLASGGIPPFGQDFNGILNWVTTIAQWSQAGAPTIYDATFATAIGGYPKGAVLQSATLDGRFWRSTVESNTTDPDGGGAGWASFFAPVFANPTFTGTLTASGPAAFNSTVGLGASAVAGTQAVNDNSTKVSTTAYADRAATNAYNAAVAWASGNDAAVQAAAAADATTKANNALAAAEAYANAPILANGAHWPGGLRVENFSFSTTTSPFSIAWPDGVFPNSVFPPVASVAQLPGPGQYTVVVASWDTAGVTVYTRLNGVDSIGIAVNMVAFGY